MDIIYQLPSQSDNTNLLWKLEDDVLYNKHTQYVKCETKDEKHEKEFKSFLQFATKYVSVTPSSPATKATPEIVVKSKNTKEENTKEENTKEENTKEENTKKERKRKSPMSLIIELTENIEVNSEYMRSSMIEFISKKEFHKFFGVKKTSEVMAGISGNKWNKSLVLFLSFMFDMSFVYLNKPVKFDSEKDYQIIITI